MKYLLVVSTCKISKQIIQSMYKSLHLTLKWLYGRMGRIFWEPVLRGLLCLSRVLQELIIRYSHNNINSDVLSYI